MGGFWNSFYQGWEQGDKIGERNKKLGLEADIKKASEEAPQETAADVDQYTGQVLKPASFKYGDQVSSTQFTPEQIQDIKARRYADIYEKNGDVGTANVLRSSAQQMKLGKVQLETAQQQAKERQEVARLFKIKTDVDTGKISEEEGLQQLINRTDKYPDDGVTHSYVPIGNGMFKVTQHYKNRETGSDVGTFNDAFNKAHKWVSPETYKEVENNDRANKGLELQGKQVGIQQQQADETGQYHRGVLGVNRDELSHKIENDAGELEVKRANQKALENYYQRLGLRSSSGGGSSRVKGIGYIKTTGQPVEYSPEEGYYTRDENGKTQPVRDMRNFVPVGSQERVQKPEMSMTDKINLNKYVDEALLADPAYKQVKNDPNAVAALKQRIAAKLTGEQEDSTTPDYLGHAAALEGDTPAGLQQKPDWYRNTPAPEEPVVKQNIIPQGSRLGSVQIIPRNSSLR